MTRLAYIALALGLVAPASAHADQVLQIEVAGAIERLVVPPVPYTPVGLAVPATPMQRGGFTLVSEFRIRAWTEAEGAGGGVRVAVFAVLTRKEETLSTQIASVVVGSTQAVEIAATEKFNARRITLKGVGNSSTPRPRTGPAVTPATWRLDSWRGDVPTDPGLRPWPPPPRSSR